VHKTPNHRRLKIFLILSFDLEFAREYVDVGFILKSKEMSLEFHGSSSFRFFINGHEN